MQKEIVVASAVRTAVGTYGGSLKDMPTVDLAALVVREAVERAGVSADSVGHVVFGNVVHGDPRDMYLSRYAAVQGGLSVETPAFTLNRLCGSGLQAIVSAAQQIETGHCDIAVAGGAESMSRAAYWAPAQRWGAAWVTQMVDAMVGALHDPFENIHMGVTAENIAEKWGISREEQDAFAAESHNRAERAWAEDRFAGQIVPVELKSRKGVTVFEKDEHFRAGMDAASMAKLKPVFKKDGSVTAGNASGLNDAAAALVLCTREAAEAQGPQAAGPSDWLLARRLRTAIHGHRPGARRPAPVREHRPERRRL